MGNYCSRSFSIYRHSCWADWSKNKTVAIVNYRLQALEKKVEQHNKVVERMLIAENEIKTMKKEIEKVEVEMHDFEYK